MEKMINSREVYKGRILRVTSDEVELDDGRRTSRDVIRHSGSVAMIPYDDKNNEILLVRQYRHAVEQEILEIPAGTLENGEVPEDAVKRELAEEVKMCAEKTVFLGCFYSSPGFLTEKIYLFLCTGLEKREAEEDFDEKIEVVRVKRGELWKMAMENRIMDAKTVLALLLWESQPH